MLRKSKMSLLFAFVLILSLFVRLVVDLRPGAAKMEKSNSVSSLIMTARLL
ncbi:MAG: hypothetical protein ACQEXE_11190 [Bacillota bacterium]